MFELGIISDEIGDDFERSCRLIRDWGMTLVELRTLWGTNVLELSEDALARARDAIREHGLRVSAIASPVFKSPLDGKPRQVAADFALEGVESFEAQFALLDRTLELCRYFEAGMARVFTFWREPWHGHLAQRIAEKLAEAAMRAQPAGIRLVVENEPVCSVGSGWQLGALDAQLQSVAEDHLDAIGLLWDPGNALAAGEPRPYPDGYRSLDPARIAHVHLKDALIDERGEATFVPLGTGAIDYRTQLRALQDDGYAGALVLEPHYRPEGLAREEAARLAVEAAQSVIAEAAADAAASAGTDAAAGAGADGPGGRA
jgi:L-ribulose-5-phosphate 3-epimerase